MAPRLHSQTYFSSRGGSYDRSFEEVVLQGLAKDGGLFLPEEIPSLPSDWSESWINLSFQDLAFRIFSLYIGEDEIPAADLEEIIRKSYSTFLSPEITPVVPITEEKRLYLLELFHGPTKAFKDVALQFLGNLFEYFLVRKNKDKDAHAGQHLCVVGATSGDTGSAAIYGLRGKKDVSVTILHPNNKISPVQEAQMCSVLDSNVHNLAVDGTFDDCQDLVKALFGDEEINRTHKIGAVNSINFARILAQITYYFYAYAALVRSNRINNGDKVRFSVPCGNFGDILAGYFAKRMGLPVEKLLVATNSNDILHRFWQSGHYEKKPVHSKEANGGFPEDGVKAYETGVQECISCAMDVLVSSNFERLLWFLAYEVETSSTKATADRQAMAAAGAKVKTWMDELKTNGGFGVDSAVLKAARADFISTRVSDLETLATIKELYRSTPQTLPSLSSSSTPTATGTNHPNGTADPHKGYILDPHTAVGINAALRLLPSPSTSSTSSTQQPAVATVSLATAHPAKFSRAVEEALKEEPGFRFLDIIPREFAGLEDLPRRKTQVKRADGLKGLRDLIRERVPASGSGE